MTLDPRLTSIEGRARLAFALAIDLPDPTPAQAAGVKMDPIEFARCLKQLGKECEALRSAARQDDFESFTTTFNAARNRAAAIEVLTQRSRRQWAAAALELNASIERYGRSPGSSHLALVEWCREVLFAIAAGANIERLAGAMTAGTNTRTTENELRENWRTIRGVLASLDDVRLHEFVGAIDAELSVLERADSKMSVEEISDPPEDVLEGGRYVREQNQERTGDPLTWLDRAKIILSNTPTLSDRKVAKAVGVSHSTLSRCPKYQEFAGLIRNMNSGAVRRGQVRRGGEIEAIDNDGDPASMEWD